MEEKAAEVDLSKLSLQELLDHKSWKARQKGYEDVNVLMQQASNGKDPIFTKYGASAKSWASDGNVNALEKGLDAVFTFVENAANASRSAQEICPVLVQKCLAHAKPKIREKAQDILLLYVEIEKPDVVTDALIDGFANKNPKVVSQSITTFTVAVQAFGVQALNVKNVMKHIAPLLENRDKDVRQQTKALSVELYRWIGALALKPQLQNIKPVQLTELEEEFAKEKEVVRTPTRYLRSQKPQAGGAVSGDLAGDEQGSSESGPGTAVTQQVVDSWEFLQPFDVLSKLPKDFFEQVESSKWAERKESLECLLKLCTDNPRLDPTSNYGELVSILKKIISKDSNIHVVSLAAKCVAALADGLRKKFAPFASMLVPIVLEKFKEKKPLVSNACVEAIDSIFKTTTLETIAEDVVCALDNKTPSVRHQTALFLSRSFATSHPSILSKKLMKTFCAALVKNMESPDLDVRNAAASALGAALKVVGDKNVMPFLTDIKDDHLKMDKIKECCEKTVVDPSISAASLPVAQPQQSTANKDTKNATVSKSSAAASKNSSSSSAAVSNRKVAPSAQTTKRPTDSAESTDSKATIASADEESKQSSVSSRSQSVVGKAAANKNKKEPDVSADSSALLNTNSKAQRFQDEKSLRILKWNFTTPTEEHVEQLQNQLSTICKPALHANLFNSNFKMHLKAIETLTQCLETAPDAAVNGSDLLLKWCTLRFFETNPSVLIKSLEFIQQLLQLLVERQVELHDYEVGSFVPYVLLKAGDQKDAVRSEVRKIIQKLARLYPPAKLFQLLLEAVKSTKNSRQKAECIEQLGSFIDVLGVSVCGSPPTQSLRAVAQCIGEKDTTVRNAALNAIVSAYNHMGDKVHKVIGAMNEKDFAMLQERIKRSSKAKPNTAAFQMAINNGSVATPVSSVDNTKRPKTAQPVVGRRSPATSQNPLMARERVASPAVGTSDATDLKFNDNANTDLYDDAALSSETPSEPGLFRLEISKIFDERQMDLVRRFGQRQPLPPSLISADVERELAAPFRMPKLHRPSTAPAVAALGRSPATESARSGAGDSAAASGTGDDALAMLDTAISQVTSSAMATSVQALVQLDEILKDPANSRFLVGKVDQLLMAIYFQLRMACNTRMKDTNVDQDEVLRLYRHLCVVLLSLCSAGCLIEEASEGALKDLTCQLLTVLVDERLKQTSEGSELVRSINMLVVNLVTKSDHTSCLVALLRLLRDALHSQTSSIKFHELVMRCIWKISRQLPAFVDQLQLNRVLAECHQFFMDFPTDTWQDRSSNMPLRTVKTILNSLCNLVGDKILDHVTMIDRPDSSEAVLYLKRCLKK